MSNHIVPIDGKDFDVETKLLDTADLQLDPNNPRISFFKDNQTNDSLKEEQIIFALTQKKPEAFRKLKDSIHNNRGIVFPIWVQPMGKKFLIVEGNSRALIYIQLSKEEPNEKAWKKITANILPQSINDEDKNFIRLLAHLRGTNEWDAYEKAKYLYKLWKEEGWSKPRLEKQTKLSIKQIEENIKAYEIMEEQYLVNFGDDPNEINKFSYFVEYVKDNKLQKNIVNAGLGIGDFCSWVNDRNKIPTGQDVRQLNDLFNSEETRKVFLNKGFDAAIQILELKKPHLFSPLYKRIDDVIDGLKNLSSFEIDEIINETDSEKTVKIRELAKWSNKVLNQISK